MGSGRVKLIKYGVTTVLAGVVTFFLVKARYPGADAPAADRYRALCDAFSIPAVLLIAFGALLWVSGEGAFTGISWAARNAILLLIPGKALERETYAEYRARRKEGKASGYGFLFIVGLVFFAISMVFLILYNNAGK